MGDKRNIYYELKLMEDVEEYREERTSGRITLDIDVPLSADMELLGIVANAEMAKFISELRRIRDEKKTMLKLR